MPIRRRKKNGAIHADGQNVEELDDCRQPNARYECDLQAVDVHANAWTRAQMQKTLGAKMQTAAAEKTKRTFRRATAKIKSRKWRFAIDVRCRMFINDVECSHSRSGGCCRSSRVAAVDLGGGCIATIRRAPTNSSLLYTDSIRTTIVCVLFVVNELQVSKHNNNNKCLATH